MTARIAEVIVSNDQEGCVRIYTKDGICLVEIAEENDSRPRPAARTDGPENSGAQTYNRIHSGRLQTFVESEEEVGL